MSEASVKQAALGCMLGVLTGSRRLIAAVIVTVAAAAASHADPLTERGIDTKTLELMVSELSTDLRYTRFAEIEVRTAEETLKDRLLIVFDPDTPAGINLDNNQ